ncbi:leukocyte elastase inhibitor C-like, partial [Dermacentor silvarum]|uniref:leukocyte elastase inhibitor C-like n=1 Tax=Dermacentor silvarum TaxID=543639 RepID=UPI0018990205
MKSSKKDTHLVATSSRRLKEGEGSKTDKANPDVEESAGPSSSSEQETLASRDRGASHRKARPLPNENVLNDAMLQFAVDVYLQLRGGTSAASSNVLFSPLAVQTVMALMLALAEGRTAAQLAQALHLHGCPYDDFKLYMRRRAYKLTGLAGGLNYFCFNNKTQLITGTDLDRDASAGSPLRAVIDSLLVEHQHADFALDGEGVRERVNEWLHVMSAFECEHAIPQGAVNGTTSFLVASVTSLRAADWKWKFRLKDTTSALFYESSGAAKRVTMMRQRGHFPTADCDEELDAAALELRYRRYKKSMVLILPRKRDGLTALETALTGPRLQSCLDRLQDRGSVDVRLPKFAVKQAFDLNNVLPRLGVVDLLVPGLADLPGLAVGDAGSSGRASVRRHLSLAVHCASVQTKEKGHKVGPWDDPQARLTFTVDHPFMFVVLSRAPEAVLFMGS